MRPSFVASLFFTVLVCSRTMATEPYEVRDIRLGGSLLEAYQTLKSRYGDAVAVKQWRRHGADTVSVIARRDYCGPNYKTTCERMTVSSVLPLYRERVVRIELNQTFIRRRTEKELVDSLVQKYGQPFLSRIDARRHFSARTMVWSANTNVPPSRVRHANSWVDYRLLEASFVVTRFNIERDGKVSALTFVSENHDLRDRNRRSVLDDGDRFKQALIRNELHF